MSARGGGRNRRHQRAISWIPQETVRSRCGEPLAADDEYVTGAPDLAIEIGSPSTRQRNETIERRLYERSGAVEYWVVDPAIDVMRVHGRSGKGFARAVELSAEGGDTVTPPLLPGLEIRLPKVFRE